MMDLSSKMMDCASKMMDFASKMMDFAQKCNSSEGEEDVDVLGAFCLSVFI